MSEAGCTTCKFRGIYERKPRSILGRLWRWHTKFCPGWKGYMKSLSEEERAEVMRKLDELAQQAQ